MFVASVLVPQSIAEMKHDGNQRRPLLPSEYTQMAGRAGRRGALHDWSIRFSSASIHFVITCGICWQLNSVQNPC